jgi:colanic acid/amylovoran biosynthesis glycosyltransferase
MKNRILIFTHNYPYGKSEPFFETELNYLDQAFEKISLLPVEIGRDKKIRHYPEKIEILKPAFNDLKKKSELLIKGIFNTSIIHILVKNGNDSGVFKSVTRFRIWVTHLLLIRSLLKEIQNRDLISLFDKFDILYFYWGVGWSQILPFLPADLKAKIVVRFHGSDLYEYTNNGYIPWRHEQFGRIHKIITISEAGKKYAESNYPFIKEKILLSRIGTKDYGINTFVKSDTLRIVSCSNLVPVKRVDLIIKTLAFICTPVHWIHFGDGPEKESILKAAEELPGNIKAELKGVVSHDDLMNFFRSNTIDLFLNVSSSEGVPVSVMEAMSFGIPVIATNVGGTSEIVSDETGLLIDQGFSPEELSVSLLELTRRDDLQEIRAAARQKWEEKSMAEKIFPVFTEQLLSICDNSTT